MKYPHIAGRIFNTPLLIHPQKLDAIIYGLSDRLGVQYDRPAPGLYVTQQGEARRPGYSVVGRVAVVDVFGVLAHRGGIDADSSYVLGYQELSRMIEAAQADRDADAVVMVYDTPGGEASGVDDMADQIREMSKPVHAAVSNHAHSAGMWLASAANSISIARTGWAGSVGVVMRHVDMSAALYMDGVKVTHIYAGEHKVDGNPYEPLPDPVRDQFQAEIDGMYSMFVDAVAANRGLSPQAVRDTEARSFMGLEAVANGFADRIETPDKMIARLNKEFSAGSNRGRIVTSSTVETPKMTIETTTGEQPEQRAAPEVDVATIKAEAAQAERQRIAAIMDCKEATGRESLARHFALKTDMAQEAAEAALAASPIAATLEATNPFEEAMNATRTPGISGDDPGCDSGDDVATMAAQILKFKSA